MTPTDSRTSEPDSTGLTVAVTGPTGTLGHGLIPLLQADDRIDRIIGIARRPFDPAAFGWTKMTYRRGDVRDVDALGDAFEGADVVIHLAFIITGTASASMIRSVNIDGTLNAFSAAARVEAQRFVYSSSAAAYGFHVDNPDLIEEDWPTRPDHRFFYAEEKAELELLLTEEATRHPEVALYRLRPPIVLGPHAVGAKELFPAFVPDALRSIARTIVGSATSTVRRLPVRLPIALPAIPLQFVHEDDVGSAILQCVLGAGPPGAYNIAGDGILTAHDIARELGLIPIALPIGIAQSLARAVAAAPVPTWLPPVFGWAEAMSQPVLVDTSKARHNLDWHPAYSGLEALRSTIHRSDPPV